MRQFPHAFRNGPACHLIPTLLLLLLASFEFLPAATAVSGPTGARSTAGSGSVIIGWNALSGASSYKIYQSLTSGGEGTTPVVSGIPSNVTNDTISSLTNGTKYYFQVTAVVSGVETSHSNEASATPGSSLLAAPLLRGIGSTGQASLAWTAISGATSYNLYRTSSAGSSMIQIGLTSTSFTDTGLTNTITYTYTAYPVSANGQGNASNSVSILPGATPLAAPVLTATESGSSSIALAWNTISVASSYDLYRGTSAGGEGAAPFVIGLTPSGPGMTYNDTGLTNGTRYYYKAVAVGTGGEGTNSNEASATTGSTLLAAPILTGSSSSGQAALKWGAVSGAASYDIYRWTGSGYNPVPYAAGVTGTTFTDTGLTNGTTYNYLAYGVGTGGEGNGSNEVTVIPGSATISAPVLVATEYSSTSVKLVWSTVSGSTSFNLYRSTSAGGEGAVPYVTGITPLQVNGYTDTGLTTNTIYYYKVVGVGAAGEGSSSNEASAKPGVSPLPAPVLKGVGSSGQSALAWSTVTGTTSYALWRSVGGGTSLTPYLLGLTGNTYTDTGLTNTTSYGYSVYGVNVNGEGAASNSISILPGGTTPAAPLLWATSVSGQTTLILTWTPAAGATSYDLYRGTSTGGEGTVPVATAIAYTTTAAGLVYSDTGLTSGTTYYYKVVGVSNAGEGALSNEASAKVGVSPLSAPTGLTATVAPNNGNTITLAWNTVTGSTSYTIFRIADTAGGTPTIYQTGVTTTSFVDTVAYAHSYIYQVAGVNSAGTGLLSTATSSLSLYGFCLSPNGAPITVTRGTIGVVGMLATPSGGYTSNIVFTESGIPAGVTSWAYPGALTFLVPNPSPIYSAGYPSQFTFGIMSTNWYLAAYTSALPGIDTIYITGSSTGSDGFIFTEPVTITIN